MKLKHIQTDAVGDFDVTQGTIQAASGQLEGPLIPLEANKEKLNLPLLIKSSKILVSKPFLPLARQLTSSNLISIKPAYDR